MKRVSVVVGSRADFYILKPLIEALKEAGLLTDWCNLRYLDQEGVIHKLNSFYSHKGLGSEATIVLGDRSEILLAAFFSVLHKIPVIHLHGGEITRGSMDEYFRHAITKLSMLHFTSTEQYRKRVISMGEAPDMVHAVGSIGVWRLLKQPRVEGINSADIVVCYHPDTMESKTKEEVDELVAALRTFRDHKIMIIGPNKDDGHEIVEERMKSLAYLYNNITYTDDLGDDYIWICANAKVCVGNSSSFVIEVPSLGTPVVLVGERQSGRLCADSVIPANTNRANIIANITDVLNMTNEARAILSRMNNPYEPKEDPIEKIIEVIKETPATFKKEFYENPMRNTR